MKKLLLVCFAVLFFIPSTIFSQPTKIRGRVIDAETQEPLPFVNILLDKTTEGTMTNDQGYYSLTTNVVADSISCMMIGYKTIKKKINPHHYQVINFNLPPETYMLTEVEVKTKRRGKTFAEILIDSMRVHADENNKNKLEAYQYDVYNKMEFDLNNIDSSFIKQKIFKPFKFVFDYLDTSAVNGQTFLPIMLIENYSTFYFNNSPKRRQEIIKATHISGLKNETINQFMGAMYIDINPWNAHISLFDKGFISPISGLGKLYYKYYLLDSNEVNGEKIYHIGFQPILKRDLVFNGEFWINKSDYSLRKVVLKIAPFVNLNFVNNIEIKQEYKRVQGISFVKKESLVVDFNVFQNPNLTQGFFGRKTTIYNNIIINKPKPLSFFNTLNPTIVTDSANDIPLSAWDTIRPEKLSTREANVYHMIDTIKHLPIFRTYVDIINTIVSGHYTTKYFKFGPYGRLISFNTKEGMRLRIGGKTTTRFSKHLRLLPYIAYGIKDEEWKGGLSILYIIKNDLWRSFSFSGKHDVAYLGQSHYKLSEDNFLATLLNAVPNRYLSPLDEYSFSYKHEWYHGLQTDIGFKKQLLYPITNTYFLYYNDGVEIKDPTLITSELSFNARFSFKERYLVTTFNHLSLGSKYPILNIHVDWGLKNVLQSDFSYQDISINLTHSINLYPLGYLKYKLSGGQIFGTIPYPLWHFHPGNQSFILNTSAFNLMNYYEFASDRYLDLYVSHFFDGFFLNKIPLLARLKWRSLVWAHGVAGSLHNDNLQFSPPPEQVYMFNKRKRVAIIKPYWETGIGIENIFKILRIDAIWRLSYLDHPNITKFGIRFNLAIKF